MSIRLKSREQIETMREGGRRHAEILRTLSALVAPGVSTQVLEDEARRLVEAGGDKAAFLGYTPRGAERPFPAALCVSINDEIVHGIPNESPRIIKEGDLVSLDLGLVHEGFVTDAAVTVPAGRINAEERKLLGVAQEALAAGCEAAKDGNTVGDVGFAISEVVKGSEFSLARDLCGHGVGFEVHEDPYVPNFGKRGEGEVLKPGMVIAIEPMVNAGKPGIRGAKDGYTLLTSDGSKSVHFEHTVAITEGGSIVLTQI